MNKFIKEQLKKVKIAKIPAFDDDTTELIIDKVSEVDIKSLDTLSVGKCYRIVVADYIIRPFDGFTLHDNWNQGIVPTDPTMNIEVIQVMGKMVKVNAVGVVDNKLWSGWLPQKSILHFEELD